MTKLNLPALKLQCMKVKILLHVWKKNSSFATTNFFFTCINLLYLFKFFTFFKSLYKWFRKLV